VDHFERHQDDAEAPRLVAWEGLTNAHAAKVLGCTTAASRSGRTTPAAGSKRL
jgi:hypothetical protein